LADFITILFVTYFVTSITMPDPQSRCTSHTVNDVSAPSGIALARCKFHSQIIFCVKLSLISTFS